MEQEDAQAFLGCSAADGDAAACVKLGEECAFDESTAKCLTIKQKLQAALERAATAPTTEEQAVAFQRVEQVAQEGHAAALEDDAESTTFIDQITTSVTGTIGRMVKLGILVAAATSHPELLAYLKQENVITTGMDGESTLSAYVADFCLEDGEEQVLEGGAVSIQFEPLPEVPEVDFTVLARELEGALQKAPRQDPEDRVLVDFTQPLAKQAQRLFAKPAKEKFDRVIHRAYQLLEGMTPDRAALSERVSGVFGSVAKFFERLGLTTIPKSLRALWDKLVQKPVEGGLNPLFTGVYTGTLLSMGALGDVSPGILLVLTELTGLSPVLLFQLSSIYVLANSFVGSLLFKLAAFMFDASYSLLEKGKLVDKAETRWQRVWNLTGLIVRKAIQIVTIPLNMLATVVTYAFRSVFSLFPWFASKFGINLGGSIERQAAQIADRVKEVTEGGDYPSNLQQLLQANAYNAFATLASVQTTGATTASMRTLPSTPLFRNAASAVQKTKSKLWTMIEQQVAIEGPITLTYHTHGKRAVCVIGEVHMDASLARAPVGTKQALRVDEFILQWLKHSGAFVDLFLEAGGGRVVEGGPREPSLQKLRRVFSPCFSRQGGECATSSTARVHAADPPSQRYTLDALQEVLLSDESTFDQQWNALITFYAPFSATLAQIMRNLGRPLPANLSFTMDTEMYTKLANDLIPDHKGAKGDLWSRSRKVGKYLKNIDPQYIETFQTVLLTTIRKSTSQVAAAIATALEMHGTNKSELQDTLYENAFPMVRMYMDAYLIARMFKKFEVTGDSQPEYAYHSVVYAGDAHSNAYRCMLRSLGFTERLRLQSPACPCENCRDSKECDQAGRNMTILLTPEQSKVLLTFTK